MKKNNGVVPRKWVKLISAASGLLFLVLLGGVYFAADYFATAFVTSLPVTQRVTAENHASLVPGLAFQAVTLVTADVVKLQAYTITSKNGAAVILLHGYKADHTMMIPIAVILVNHGYGVMLPDFRGHGASQGQRITFGKDEVMDVDAAYRYMAAQPGIDPRRIGLFGNSMGSAVAILYSARHAGIRATVAQSPFASLSNLVWQNARQALGVPPILLSPVIQFRIEQKIGINAAVIASIAAIHEISPRPVFILMGGQDTMVDPKGGESLYQAAGEPKQFWYDPLVSHLGFQEKYPQEFERRVIQYFDTYLK